MEIGSEFWLDSDAEGTNQSTFPDWLKLGSDNKLLLSGRTSIDYILKDILNQRDISTVYFPSYACDSMIQPFEDNGISLIFYNVYYENGIHLDININQKCVVFFAMNYFGFSDARMDDYIEAFKDRDIVVIEDITHSLLSEKPFNIKSDYIFGSLRKWFPLLSGGIAAKREGQFKVELKNETNLEMVTKRKTAMLEKAQFIKSNSNYEKKFIKKYNDANKILSSDYSLYNIDPLSHSILHKINKKSIEYIRNENVDFLYRNLSKKKYIHFLDKPKKVDCLLFLPILLNTQQERDELRIFLVKNNIYCPVHWPKPKLLETNISDDFYNRTLSLVVDHRYNTKDLKQVVRRLEEYYE